jgi:lipopolysaccharide assembly outer membrane protein LptD (OstA)
VLSRRFGARRWLISLPWTPTALVAAIVVVLTTPLSLHAQYEPLVDQVIVTAPSANTWVDGDTHIIQLKGPVTIALDKTQLSAESAVMWVTPLRGVLADQRRVEVALIGSAKVSQPNEIERSGPKLYVTSRVRGSIRMTAERAGGDQSQTDSYKQAVAMRPVAIRPGDAPGKWIEEEQPLIPATQPSTQPSRHFRPSQPVTIAADRLQTVETADGVVAAVLTGNIKLFQRTEVGDFIELEADRAVVFTPFHKLTELEGANRLQAIEQAVTGAYLEGDVRIVRTPADQRREGEQRLRANRAYYDFTTDRAALTDVVLHTIDPKTEIPIVVRARLVRQLSKNEYTAENARISSSSFNTPAFHIGAASTYIRQTDFDNEITGTRTNFIARNATFNIGGVPVFYLPAAGGTVVERSALRSIQTAGASKFGFGVLSEWGLFESLGQAPPKGLDLSYKLDYFTKRGPAAGFDAEYKGGFISETTLQPWSFSGDFMSYLVYDHGEDDLGKRRVDVEPDDELRGRFFWRHQHFIPGDWHIQVTGGYISDPTFMEEWFNKDFRTEAPLQTSLYAKRQRDTEAITFLTTWQPNDFATVAEVYQEQAEIERAMEIGYLRVGDSVLSDKMTFFSTNSVSNLRFDQSNSDLEDLGFRPQPVGFESPGLPSFGQTGTPGTGNWRGDFRQELDFPFSAGRLRVVPYVVGRFTQYSESPDGGSHDRAYAAAGMRITTAFWKVDDTVESKLFDLHRLRHVIEPQINLYTSAQSADRSDLFIYDEPIDAITDISAVQLALHQRWQTKRGGPGRWRSVDFFTLNTELNLFANKPSDEELDPINFRGLFFTSIPEASIPRDSINGDFLWRVSDTVSVFGDGSYNINEDKLATAGIGFGVRQGRVGYSVGLRHIGLDFTEIVNGNSFTFEQQDLLMFGFNYELTSKYNLVVQNSYDLAQHRNDRSFATLVRKFDRFFVAVSVRVDSIGEENAVFLNVWPEGVQPPGGNRGVSASAIP